jgi:N-hydroxyarylamine O-acetyltransferase
MAESKVYLQLLGLERQPPSLPFLNAICTAHLQTFPFENMSKLARWLNGVEGLPTVHEFLQARRTLDAGGTCYSINGNVHLLLNQLGFNSQLAMLGGEHMGIIVLLDGTRYYVDCGAAAPFFEAVPLHLPKTERTFGNDVVAITAREDRLFDYKRYLNGAQTGKTWSFQQEKSYQIADFQGLVSASYQPTATFMGLLRCQLYQLHQQRSVSLVNNRFTISKSNGERTTTTLSSVEAIEDVLANEFNLPNLPVRQAIAALTKIGIDPFAKQA